MNEQMNKYRNEERKKQTNKQKINKIMDQVPNTL